jgi:hypothetical protein
LAFREEVNSFLVVLINASPLLPSNLCSFNQPYAVQPETVNAASPPHVRIRGPLPDLVNVRVRNGSVVAARIRSFVALDFAAASDALMLPV